MPQSTLMPYEFQCEATTCLRSSRTICIHDVRPYFHPECFEAEYGVAWGDSSVGSEASGRAANNAAAPSPGRRHPTPSGRLVPPPVPE